MENAEFICSDDYYRLLPDGEYEAECVSHQDRFWSKGRKLFLNFRITIPWEWKGERVFMAFNMPRDGRITPGMKYYRAWRAVNGGRPPSKNAKMSPRLFLYKHFRICTRTVKPKDNGEEMPSAYWYSVVDRILSVVGDPLS